MKPAPYTTADFDRNPLMLYYEVTQACDLVCKHCRASAQPSAHPEELSHVDSLALIEQAARFPRRPNLVFTGGDPLKRADLWSLIEFGVEQGLTIALTPSATPLATREAFERAKQAGVRALGISLDGANAATHDAFRGWEGSFDRTLAMLDAAAELELPVQVNTTITQRNFAEIDAIAELLATQRIMMWSVFFLVPVGRGLEEKRILPGQYEQAFERLWYHAQNQPYAVKTTEAPHYRRYVLQHGGHPLDGPSKQTGRSHGHRAPLGVGDGKGVMFVSHVGEIYPAGFLPLVCGKFPRDSIIDVYQNHEVFRALRNPDGFSGRCGYCEYRYVCGGSRARAYALTGDPTASDPDCAYTPQPQAAPVMP